ncbi:MAG: HU family DNA-binding protein [Chitinophagales bacterium]|nr:HU family DNA-binding protein [Chitinophagales bacterium]
MNKSDLVDKIAKDAKITKTEANKVLDSLMTTVKKSLKKGDRVTLVGFGTWSVSKRKSRMGRNPQTGKAIKIPAKKVVKFKAGKTLAEKI